MEVKKYIVVLGHTSQYPEPLTLKKGTPLVVGKKHEGPEGWNDWFFCDTPGQKGGWVPARVIEIVDGNTAQARADYTARELNVREGDLLLGSRVLNGWLWCDNPGSSESGWVPLANLQEVPQ
jgi:hypothetical protein